MRHMMYMDMMDEREEGGYEVESNEKVKMMDRACRDEAVTGAVERMRRK